MHVGEYMRDLAGRGVSPRLHLLIDTKVNAASGVTQACGENRHFDRYKRRFSFSQPHAMKNSYSYYI